MTMTELRELVIKSVGTFGSDSEYYADEFFYTCKAQGMTREESSDLWDEIEDSLSDEYFTC